MENHNPRFYFLNRYSGEVFGGIIDDICFSSESSIEKNGSKSMYWQGVSKITLLLDFTS